MVAHLEPCEGCKKSAAIACALLFPYHSTVTNPSPILSASPTRTKQSSSQHRRRRVVQEAEVQKPNKKKRKKRKKRKREKEKKVCAGRVRERGVLLLNVKKVRFVIFTSFKITFYLCIARIIRAYASLFRLKRFFFFSRVAVRAGSVSSH